MAQDQSVSSLVGRLDVGLWLSSADKAGGTFSAEEYRRQFYHGSPNICHRGVWGQGWAAAGSTCTWGVDGRLLERFARGEWMADYWNDLHVRSGWQPDCWLDLHVGSGWQTAGSTCTWGVDDRMPQRTLFVFRPLRWQFYLCGILKLSFFFVFGL